MRGLGGAADRQGPSCAYERTYKEHTYIIIYLPFCIHLLSFELVGTEFSC